ncbi:MULTISPECIES: winged helix-turn-helix domain-containing protein [Streptomyces]|uniref:winged helix-turn-helix domain-containing protein n=1 Tax=Streptomyces TaxID=1883 RepID=UPI0027BAD3E3|nr:winged helix-turn-helix domain-containing protein [Streptomyces fildesensis]
MPNSWSSSRLDLHIDLDAAGGRRAGLESALRTAIRQGRLPAGALLPSTRGLAQELGIARGTVSAAYDQLVEEGHLTTRPGSGTIVADTPHHTPAPTRPEPAPTAPPPRPPPRAPRHQRLPHPGLARRHPPGSDPRPPRRLRRRRPAGPDRTP